MTPEDFCRIGSAYDTDPLEPDPPYGRPVSLTAVLCWLAAALMFGFFVGWSIPW